MAKNGYVGKDISNKMSQGTKATKMKTGDVYMKDGYPCGDMEAVSAPGGFGGGPEVGGYAMPSKNKFPNGIPNEGRESILAEPMTPVHAANKKDSVLSTKEDPTWGGIITPQDMGVHNTFGIS